MEIQHGNSLARRRRLARARGLLVVAVVLQPIWLSPEPIGSATEAQPRAASSPHLVPAPVPQSEMKLQMEARLDKEAFLASFRRQAAAELTPCLRSWSVEHGSLLLLGRLHRNGKFSALRVLPAATDTPACLVTSTQAMEFSQLTKRLAVPSVEIQWRVDW